MGKTMLRKSLKAAFVALALLGGAATPGLARETVPLDAFAMMPTVLDVAVSPNGKQIGIIRATSKEGGYVLEIRETRDLESKPVRIGAERMELREFYWVNNDRVLVGFRQNVKSSNSDYWVEKYATIKADATGKWEELPESTTKIVSLLPKDSNEILIETDANENRIPDVMRFNVNNGRTSLVLRGNDRMGDYNADIDGEVRGATGYDAASGEIQIYARLKGSNDWKLIRTVDPKKRETFDIRGFSVENPNEVYILASNGQDKAGIHTLNIETGQISERLFGLKSVDATNIIRSGKRDTMGLVTGFIYYTNGPKRYFIDGNEKAIHDGVKALFPGKDANLVSRSGDDNAIVIRTSSPKDPGSFYLLTNLSKLEFIASHLPLLKPEHLADVKLTRFKARDGLTIPAYITQPEGDGPFPAIVMPHGGPWARDYGGFDEWAQLLAHHGYIVIQPQFRGSEGFGLNHWIAGDAEWGLKMQDDVDDAALFLVEKGLATRDKLAIFGWSYGGYSAFVGAMRDDNIYQCSIPGAGVSDLSLIRGGLAESKYLRQLQRPTIKGVSPIDQVEKVNIPMLVVHGDIDRIVEVSHSRRFVDKLESLGKDYKYVELKGADHKGNQLYYNHKTEFYSALLDFLASDKCFGK